MGTVKYSGPVASFHCPTNAEIRSLKVHFSPKQLGEGDPSPENVRPIEGWDRVEQYYSRKNMGHIVGYSAMSNNSPSEPRYLTNSHGTTLNTVNPETYLTISQSQAPKTEDVTHYQNGYVNIIIDNLIFGQSYDVSFRITDIKSNPLNILLQTIRLMVPSGKSYLSEIQGDYLIFKNVKYLQNSSIPNRHHFSIRICGMSFTLSEFMVTPAEMNDGLYEPYTQKRIVKWNQWSPPLTEENWQAYNTSNISTTFEDGIETSIWLNNTGGYSASIRTKTGIIQKNKEIWYISYMLKTSMSGGTWGAEYNGGLQNTFVNNLEADVWTRCSECSIYWRGTRNYIYINYYRSGISEHTGMVSQIKSPLFINLTQMFGSGNEPNKEEFEEQCALNGIDLTNTLPYDEGSLREWKINGMLLKNNITFPILGKNKFNINATFAEPSDTGLTAYSRIFQPYTYCLGLSSGNNYSPDKITDCSITNNTLTFTTTNTSYGVFFAIPSLYGTYRLSYTGENVSPTFIRYNSEGKLSYSGSSLDPQGIIAIGPDVSIAGVLFRSVTANTPTTVSNIQIEEGTAVTEYEEFSPKHTVYSGWVDLISGEVCETHSLKTFNGSEQQWLWSSSSNGIPYITIDLMKSGTWYSDACTICDTAIKVNVSSSGVLQCLIGYNNKRIYFYNTTSAISGVTDLNSFTNWLSTNNISITYPLETSQIYHLAPTQLQTFLGYNNVWSNADYVEVEYDLHETQDILARKQFIIANQPHIETPAPASLQSFTTDMIAPLKECKVHFGPKQDLHDYSKPWPAGGGKNLFDGTYITGMIQNNGDNTYRWVCSNTSTKSAVITCLPNTTYTIKKHSSSNRFTIGELSHYPIDLESISVFVENNNLNQYTVTTSAETQYLIIYVSTSTEQAEPDMMIELGSTASAYEPYENICPIEGWNEIEVYKTGKNLLENTHSTKTVSGITWTVNSDGSIHVEGTATGNSWLGTIPATQMFKSGISYTLSGGNNDASLYLVGVDKDGTTWSESKIGGTEKGQGKTFTLDQDFHARYQAVVGKDKIVNTDIYPMLSISGSSINFESYNGNTIPIVFPATKNLFDEKYEGITSSLTYHSLYVGNESVIASTTTPQYISPSDSTIKYSNIFVFPGQVTSGASTGTNDICIERTRIITPIDGYITIAYRNGYGVDPTQYHTQIEKGSVATFYEPYGMIYGGYIDLIKGELVQTHKKVTIGELSWRTVPTLGEGGWATTSHTPSDMSRTAMPISTIYKTINPYSSWGSYQSEEDYIISRYSPSDNLAIVIKDSQYSTVADFIAAQGNIEIVYELTTPIVYSLTSTQLKTLHGQNNIWSNANGNIEIQYWTH